MPAIFDGTEVNAITMDGTALDSLVIDGTTVWQGFPLSAADFTLYTNNGISYLLSGDLERYYAFLNSGLAVHFGAALCAREIAGSGAVPLYYFYFSNDPIIQYVGGNRQVDNTNTVASGIAIADSITDGNINVRLSGNGNWYYRGTRYVYFNVPPGYSHQGMYDARTTLTLGVGDLVLRFFHCAFGFENMIVNDSSGLSYQNMVDDFVYLGANNDPCRIEVLASEATTSGNFFCGLNTSSYTSDGSKEFLLHLRKI